MAFTSGCLFVFGVLICSLCALSVAELNCTSPDYNYVDCSCNNVTGIGQCNTTTEMCECGDVGNATCFRLSETSNCCEIESCYRYDLDTGDCEPTARSRTTAILLSIFFTNFGGANFYIERYDLAIPQIVLGLFLLFFQFGSCAVASTRDDDTSVPCIVCCSLNSVLSLLFLAWWIADIVILASNQRVDGNGCIPV